MLRVVSLGEQALLLHWPGVPALPQQRRIWQMSTAARRWPGVTEVVPGMNNLTLCFDPLLVDEPQLRAHIAVAIHQPAPLNDPPTQLHVIPVCYDGPDLAEVAAHCRLTEAEVVAAHTARLYQVFCLGFVPGFAYLGELDPRLSCPRRATPRGRVPAGAVAIGGNQTGVYPSATPGGWQLIGHTTTPMFDQTRPEPCLLQPGDQVRFVAC